MLLMAITTLILSYAVSHRRDKTVIYSRIISFLLAITLYLTYLEIDYNVLSDNISLFHGLFFVNSVTVVFNVFIYLITILVLTLNSFTPRILKKTSLDALFSKAEAEKISFIKLAVNNKAQQYKILEYPLVMLFIINGAVLLISSNDIISIFLSIELQSYGLYIISTIYRNSELSTKAGLTYFLLGGLSSCIILLGFSLYYANSGTTNLDGLYVINTITNSPADLSRDIDYSSSTGTTNDFSQEIDYINFSMIIMSTGFLFKVSAAPFHFWSPDVYDLVPTIVTTFISLIAKLSIFILLLEIINCTQHTFYFSWNNNLLWSSLLSLIIGTVLGLTQSRIKRLYAYSTISHIGFILLTLCIYSIESIQGFLFYIIQYTLSNLNAFLLLIAIGYHSTFSRLHTDNGLAKRENLSQSDSNTVYESVQNSISNNGEVNERSELLHSLHVSPHRSEVHNAVLDKNRSGDLNQDIDEKSYSPIQLISQLTGYHQLNPFLALSLSITLFSFLGIPPLVGFFAKQMVLSAGLDDGYLFMILVSVLTSVISAAYYLKVIKDMFFVNPEGIDKNSYQFHNVDQEIQSANKINQNIVLSANLSFICSILTLMMLTFLFISQDILNLCNILSMTLFGL